VEGGLVVERDLLARSDVLKCDKEDMAIKYLHVAVGFAAMVYVMRAVAAPATVEAPAIIDCADTESPTPGAAISFRVGYSFAGILGYLTAAKEVHL
jgi:hypothetical protein